MTDGSSVVDGSFLVGAALRTAASEGNSRARSGSKSHHNSPNARRIGSIAARSVKSPGG